MKNKDLLKHLDTQYESFIKKIWISFFKKRYLGKINMKQLARLINKDFSLFRSSSNEYLIDYQKQHHSEWLIWNKKCTTYSLCKSNVGKITLNIIDYDEENYEFVKGIYQVYDLNLNLKFDSRNIRKIAQIYDKKYRQKYETSYVINKQYASTIKE